MKESHLCRVQLQLAPSGILDLGAAIRNLALKWGSADLQLCNGGSIDGFCRLGLLDSCSTGLAWSTLCQLQHRTICRKGGLCRNTKKLYDTGSIHLILSIQARFLMPQRIVPT